MKLRAWWYLRLAPTVPLGDGTEKQMPLEVREYAMRQTIKQAKIQAKTDEGKKEFFCTLFWRQAQSGQFSVEMSEELTAAAFEMAVYNNSIPEWEVVA